VTKVLAAGAVLWRERPGGVECAVVHRPHYDDWSLPKGKLEAGESIWAAAVREVAEETGYPCFLGRHLGQLRYPVSVPVPATKVVEYFAARVAGPGEFQPSKEVDALRWLPAGEAGELLSYHGDREILLAFLALPADLTTLPLVRHALAGKRSAWDGPDDLRPLTTSGHNQAAALRDLLPRFGADRVHSAPLVRCVQTVEPLAQRLHAEIVLEPLLSERGYQGNEPACVARLRAIAAAGGTPVVCSQGDVITDLLARLAKESGHVLPNTRAAKGSTWMLPFTKDPHPQLVATYYIRKP
jgi:8-oxo-dGTP pyrophosphatase MutT (NUDIX family)/broad specificity phosphatase PhoE